MQVDGLHSIPQIQVKLELLSLMKLHIRTMLVFLLLLQLDFQLLHLGNLQIQVFFSFHSVEQLVQHLLM
jgi:hypothetical protein